MSCWQHGSLFLSKSYLSPHLDWGLSTFCGHMPKIQPYLLPPSNLFYKLPWGLYIRALTLYFLTHLIFNCKYIFLYLQYFSLPLFSPCSSSFGFPSTIYLHAGDLGTVQSWISSTPIEVPYRVHTIMLPCLVLYTSINFGLLEVGAIL